MPHELAQRAAAGGGVQSGLQGDGGQPVAAANVVEIRLAGKGSLGFDNAPRSDAVSDADSASGRVAVEYDVLTPHPRTERVALAVQSDGNRYEQVDSNGVFAKGNMRLNLRVTASTLPCVKVGEEAHLVLLHSGTLNAYLMTGLCVFHGQRSGATRNSRVHVSFAPVCVRTTAGVGGEPLCGPTQPTVATIAAEGAVRGEDIVTGALTCTGSGQKFGTGCFVNGPQNSSITVTATIDGPLPADWSWKIAYDSGVAAEQLFACPHNAETCTATIQTPDMSRTTGVQVHTKLYTPNGVTGPTLGITLQ